MASRSLKVLTAEIIHESNTLSVKPTTLKSFEKDTLLKGESAIESRGTANNTDLTGTLDTAREHGWNVDHILSAKAGPGGKVTNEAFEELYNPIIVALQKSFDDGELYDGVMLNLHGAMITDTYDDGEGELLRRIREIVGKDTPIAITLDPHANVTEKMCEHADIIKSYDTYPHVDQRATSNLASQLLHRTMIGEINPRTILKTIPMQQEANSGRTDKGPMIERLKLARNYENDETNGACAVSINAGFPANVSFGGPTILVTYDTNVSDSQPHEYFSDQIAQDVWKHRRNIIESFLTTEEMIERVEVYNPDDHDGKPLIIADFADNPGAGAYGDSTNMLAALLTAEFGKACLGPIVDGGLVERVQNLILSGNNKLGDTIKVRLGGKTDPDHGGGPLDVKAKILSIYENGLVTGEGPMLKGATKDFGKVAVLRVENVDILVVTNPQQILDTQQFKKFGIIPGDYDVVALKSEQHFRAEFEGTAEEPGIGGDVIVVDAGGLSTPLVNKKDFPKLREGIYPFNPMATYSAALVPG